MIIVQLFWMYRVNSGSNFWSHGLNEKSNWLLNWLVTPTLKNRSKFLQSQVSARLYDCRVRCGGVFFLPGEAAASSPRCHSTRLKGNVQSKSQEHRLREGSKHFDFLLKPLYLFLLPVRWGGKQHDSRWSARSRCLLVGRIT